MRLGLNGLVTLCTLSFAQFTSAHYIFASLLTESSSSSAAVRLPQENGPVPINSPGAACNVALKPATETVRVNAGGQVGFKLGEGKTIFHQGPGAMYLGKAPGKAADWDGTGDGWFKIAEWGATFNPFKFTATGQDSFMAKVPAGIPDGEYLVRMEHFALHIPRSPELYVGCAQIKVTGGGNAMPPTVAIPGHITREDPSLMMDIFYPIPTAYTIPGPAVAGGGAPAPNSPPPGLSPPLPPAPTSSADVPDASTPTLAPPVLTTPPTNTGPQGTKPPPLPSAPAPASPIAEPVGNAGTIPSTETSSSQQASPAAPTGAAPAPPVVQPPQGHRNGSCKNRPYQGKHNKISSVRRDVSMKQHRRRMQHHQF